MTKILEAARVVGVGERCGVRPIVVEEIWNMRHIIQAAARKDDDGTSLQVEAPEAFTSRLAQR